MSVYYTFGAISSETADNAEVCINSEYECEGYEGRLFQIFISCNTFMNFKINI
jgi:hypothetical protein